MDIYVTTSNKERTFTYESTGVPCFGVLSTGEYTFNNYHDEDHEEFADDPDIPDISEDEFIVSIGFNHWRRHPDSKLWAEQAAAALGIEFFWDGDYFTIDTTGKDSGDVMRNLFLVRNYSSHAYDTMVRNLMKLYDIEYNQALRLSVLIQPLVDGVGKTTLYYHLSASNPSIARATMASVERFMQDPQDAHGVRVGTFEDRIGQGYDIGSGSNVINSFAYPDAEKSVRSKMLAEEAAQYLVNKFFKKG